MLSFVILFFVFWCPAFTQNHYEYDDDLFFMNFDNEVENVIPATEETISCDCQREHTEWDKLFIMLENSQMKENMLLQSLDEILKVELQTLRGEMLRFAEKFAGIRSSCIEQAASRFSSQTDQMLAKSRGESEDLLGTRHELRGEKILSEILQLSQNLSDRLRHLEHAWQTAAEGDAQQRSISEKGRVSSVANRDDFILKSLWQELQETKAELKESQRRTTQRLLPAGCETVLLFPMRSKKIFVSVHPASEMTLYSFTLCTWVKVTEMLDKTIVFSYGTKRNPYEIQLYLSDNSVILAVGGDLNKIAASNAISSGEWTHLCGTWSTVNGSTSLWINGEVVQAASGIAEGYVIPDGGILQVGQEKNGCCVGGGFNESLAFSGKITGFNLWNRVLSGQEITRQTGEESCSSRGNIVGWGTTEVLPHGGAQYIFGH